MAFSEGWVIVKVLFFQNIGMSFSEIGFILSFTAFIIFLFEVPTGILTDFFGRKNTIIICYIIWLFCCFSLIFADSFIDLIIASFFYGLSWTLWSGSYESLIYETTKVLKIKHKYPMITNKTNIIYIGFGILTSYLAPQIFEYDDKILFIFSSVITCFLIFMSFFLKEPSYKKDKKVIEYNVYKQIISIYHIIKNDNFLKTILIFEMIWGTGIVIFVELLNQPLINNNYSLSDYGIIFASAKIFQIIFSYGTEHYIRFLGVKKFFYFLIISLFFSICFFLSFIDNKYLTIFSLGYILSIGMMNYVFISTLLNNHIKDNSIRATTLSISSMLKSLTIFVSLFIFGFVLENFGDIKTTFILFFITTTSVLFIIFKSKIDNKKISLK